MITFYRLDFSCSFHLWFRSQRAFPNCRLKVCFLLLSLPIAGSSPTSIAQEKSAPSNKELTSTYEIERGLAFAKKLLSEQAIQDARVQRTDGLKQAAFDPNTDPEVQKIRNQIETVSRELTELQTELRELDLRIQVRKELANLERTFIVDEPKVRHYLSALFAPGRTQPVKGAGNMLKITSTTVGPMSLKALKEFGALENTTDGLLRLGWAGSDNSNDRGRHAFPLNIGGRLDDHEAEFLVPAQELLVKYQNLLVAKGLLAP